MNFLKTFGLPDISVQLGPHFLSLGYIPSSLALDDDASWMIYI